ncbi:hypothetical protein HJ586_05775 [Dickeya zeae]|nr:hypothetical protein HJ586_05775 [Dickeya zeae]
MLRCEGWRDNHKRIYRLYSQQGLYPNHVCGVWILSLMPYLTDVDYAC